MPTDVAQQLPDQRPVPGLPGVLQGAGGRT